MELQKSKFLNSLVNWQKFGNATQVSIQKKPNLEVQPKTNTQKIPNLIL